MLVSRNCVDRVVYSYRVISRRCFFKLASLLESPESPMLHTPRQPGHAVDREGASSSRFARVLSRTVAKAFLVNVILLFGVSCFLLTAQEGSKYCWRCTWNRNCRLCMKEGNRGAGVAVCESRSKPSCSHSHSVNFEQRE